MSRYIDTTYPVNAEILAPQTPAQLRQAEIKRAKTRIKWLKALDKAERVAESCRNWLANNK